MHCSFTKVVISALHFAQDAEIIILLLVKHFTKSRSFEVSTQLYNAFALKVVFVGME